jgi:hypothetical protein
MKNLIMADLKVMGHRLWSVPLMALVLVVLVSIIPGLEMPDPVRNFMVALLSPCLLIFELFREEQKRSSESLIMTMPVNKSIYVLAKFATVIILCLTAFPAGWFANMISNGVQGDGFSIGISFSFMPGMLKIMLFIIPLAFYILPLYFFSRRVVVSTILGIIFVVFFTERLLTLFYEHFYVSFFDDNLYLMFYLIAVMLIPAAVIHFIIQLRFRSVTGEMIKTGWYFLLFVLFLFVFETLMKNLEYANYYFHLLSVMESIDSERKERAAKLIANFRLYVPVISFVLIMITSTLFYIRRKSSQLFWQNAVLYILAPLTIIIVSDKIGIIVSDLFTSYSKNYHSAHLIPVLAPILIAIVSFKASVYLLKNNRTLK